MPGFYKFVSAALIAFAAEFVIFFMAKHNPAVSGTNPFNEDPFDAVGSAAIQLAMFTALIGLATVLIGLECFAIILGYILFARYLCIFRETNSKT